MARANSANVRALEKLTDRLHLPNSISRGVVVGLLLARKYSRIPSRQTLHDDFGISEATAARWRAAMRAAGWRETSEQ